MADAWVALGRRRIALARAVYARDQATPGYVCPGAPGRPCGRPIDWSLRFPDPMSRSCDHTHELQDGGSLTDLDNLWTAHLRCNASKGARRQHERRREAQIIAIDPATL
jgi:5-methylcytosine-specific restriction endonuclease McrA